MANYALNIGKGRSVELQNRIKNNEPTNAAFVLVPLKVTDTEANRQDDANLEVFLAATPDEQTEGWARKVLDDTLIAAIAVDNVNNRFAGTVPETKWTAPTAGKNVVALGVCYDSDTTSGTDANILVLTVHDFAVTADGNDVYLNAGDFIRAS
jgi:hypothetical protein